MNDEKVLEATQEMAISQRQAMQRATAAWVLSLMVANAGGLLTVAAAVLQERSEALTALCMPSAWMFAAGLCLSGAINAVSALRMGRDAMEWEEARWRLILGKPEPMPDAALIRQLFWVETALEWLSAVLFFGGLIYPLSVLCHRYLISGQGFFPPS